MKMKYMAMVSVFVAFQMTSAAQALPFLQLDVSNGVYVGGSEETVTATTNPFTLYALVDSSNKQDYEAGTTYYISIGLIPSDSFAATDNFNFGSFLFGGSQYFATDEGLTFGTPPPDKTANKDQLGSHDIYDTWFIEVSFVLDDPVLKSKEYDSEDHPGSLDPDSNGTLYYKDFLVDYSSLDEGYGLHFDLYTKNSDGSVDKFAPYSHDAESGDPGNPVPEPTTMLLFGSGLVCLIGSMKRRHK